mmetsp:Transcript_103094/g.222591  ORF Transcript_103094/g.222591 Transcript_103094/m.222591 type:complete len:273 (-) Transcript_103094:411-1229(-)
MIVIGGVRRLGLGTPSPRGLRAQLGQRREARAVARSQLGHAGQQPSQLAEVVRAEDLLEVSPPAEVVRIPPELAPAPGPLPVAHVRAELDRRLVREDEVQVEAAQEGEGEEDADRDDPGERHALPLEEARPPDASPESEHVVYKEPQEGDGHKQAGRHEVEHEEAEVPVVAVAHAVVDPGAVVVHLQHAPLAHAAVVRPRRLPAAALLALLLGLRLAELRVRVLRHALVLRRAAGIHADGHHVVVHEVGQQEERQGRQEPHPDVGGVLAVGG